MTTARAPKSNCRRRAKPTAPLLPFRPQHGGRRPGAGRKPNGPEAGVDHRTRAALAPRFPVHVTVKLRSGLPRLRRRDEYAALRAAFVAGCRGPAAAAGAFRLCHYAVLNDHLHLIVEAHDRQSLSRGLQGLLIRIARKLNKLWRRKGSVFADRYHDHILKSPRETRNALRYVLQNARHHAAEGRMVDAIAPIDTFTSAPWFDGFRQTIRVRGLEAIVRPITDSRTWLLTIGWRRRGLLNVSDATG
ncbi:MAG: transposase [Planctomycetes bacterium]|nr:transposase [Planctomycetota bacterium]